MVVGQFQNFKGGGGEFARRDGEAKCGADEWNRARRDKILLAARREGQETDALEDKKQRANDRSLRQCSRHPNRLRCSWRTRGRRGGCGERDGTHRRSHSKEQLETKHKQTKKQQQQRTYLFCI